MRPWRPVVMDYRRSTPVGSRFHSHTRYELFYFHEGKGHYLIRDQIYTLAPGDLLLMHGMTLHCPKRANDAPFIRTVIYLDPAYLQGLSEHVIGLDLLLPFRKLQNYKLSAGNEPLREELEDILFRMSKHYRADDDLEYNRFLFAFLDFITVIYRECRHPINERQEALTDKERNVQQMIGFIESRYRDPIHLDDLEAELHLNKYYLARIFKQVTGHTIFQYLYERRINEAKIMLLLNQESRVTDICFQLGFKHLSHFSRMFKASTGLSPEQYRKQNGGLS